MATTERHQEISEAYLQHAEEEFEKGDMLQASEKAWGAVAHCVKGIARERDWPNRSHNDVRRNARRLIDMSSNPADYRLKLSAVEYLHINFYEEMYDPQDVLIGIDQARLLVELLNSVDSQMAR